MRSRRDRARGQAGFFAFIVIGVLLAHPIGQWLGDPPPPASWRDCRIGPAQQALLTADGDRALEIEVRGETARLSGTMTEAVTCKLRRLHEAHPEVRLLVLGDINGTIDEDATMEAALLVRDWRLATHVEEGASIASGGVTLFLGGVERSIGRGGRLGVHSWAYTDDGVEGRTLPRDHPEHRLYLEFYERIGMDPEYYWFTLDAAGAEDIHEMSNEELARFGFATQRSPRTAAR